MNDLLIANALCSLFSAVIATFAFVGFQRLFKLSLGWPWTVGGALFVFTLMFLVIAVCQRSSQLSQAGR
ncbi:MAG TPA: hypothetical protein VLH56_05180 [Dissulfurispiraceae bacterium]|nr:hypothetical protein [Dissulfurispiraceae bacterium]